MFPPFFKGTFRWFFCSWDSLGHLKTLPDGILRCLPANCGRPGGFLVVIDSGEWWQFQTFTWQTHEIYHADFLMVVIFFWGPLIKWEAGDILDLIFSGVDFRLDWHNSLGPQSLTACVDGRSWMSHFSNSWLKLLPSWHPLFHSGSVVPVWKLLRWGFKKWIWKKKSRGKRVVSPENRYQKFWEQFLKGNGLRTIFHPLNVHFTVVGLKESIDKSCRFFFRSEGLRNLPLLRPMCDNWVIARCIPVIRTCNGPCYAACDWRSACASIAMPWNVWSLSAVLGYVDSSESKQGQTKNNG